MSDTQSSGSGSRRSSINRSQSLVLKQSSSFLNENILLNETAVAPPPSRDFYQLLITKSTIFLRHWVISHNVSGSIGPIEIKNSYEDFMDDTRVHSDIQMVFGANMLEYTKGLIEGRIDYLPRLPEKLLKYILTFLNYKDLCKVAQLNKRFKELASDNSLWETLYEIHVCEITQELRADALVVSWKQLFSEYIRKNVLTQTSASQTTPQQSLHRASIASEPPKSYEFVVSPSLSDSS